MDIYLYNTADDDNVLNKTLKDELLIPNVKLKNPVNINNPILSLSSKIVYDDGYGGGWTYETKDYNYAYIPAFERYYFIENITLQSNNINVLTLKVDVLKTYEKEILNSNLYVEKEINHIIESDKTLEQEFNKILIVRGGKFE
jgi:hypothetical protein